MDLAFYNKIKKLTIVAFFSDDELMNMIVLKGGNALDIIYKIAGRSSVDIDFSIDNKIPDDKFEIIREKMVRTLSTTFNENGYELIDFNFYERPCQITEDMADFWGGYRVEFKIIEKEKFGKLKNNADNLRRHALEVRSDHKKTFLIDISKFEYCEGKIDKEFEGLTIYVYSPEMILCEKIRAICQQMPEYGKIVKSNSQSARARDFYDIYIIIEKLNIDITLTKNRALLEAIFEAKKVPLYLMDKISEYREFHRPDFQSVKDTVLPTEELKEFDFYFDYVVEKCQMLKPLWVK
ncbi:MAG: nucleotidyl transferase AbiEii/AbiGii toxin family protein [Ignavibacteria bacterium]|jgi:predicted nucleotidyltransferase component of viral defense system|nr:nucleotidyl transferase AbiEii/AbiGii toxin family protein [Ignavibacteria bacterium]